MNTDVTSKSVSRYSPTTIFPQDERRPFGTMREHRLGDYVRFSDYELLTRERDEALRAVQNCLLAVPAGEFKQKMGEWLNGKLGLSPETSGDAYTRRIERKVAAIVTWLEANQPDAFRRGLWDAVEKAGGGSSEETFGSWRLIETAPTDRTPVLVWLKGCNGTFDYGDMLVVRADQTMNAVYANRTGERFWGFPGVGGLKGSHWMPLPEPPLNGESHLSEKASGGSDASR